jgi:hypothetical protein
MRRGARGSFSLLCRVVLFALLVCVAARAHADPPAPDCGTELRAFAGRVHAYAERRRGVGAELPALRETQEPEQLAARQRALAAGIRAARAGARTGDVLGPADGCVARIVRDDWRHRPVSERQALLNEMPVLPAPRPNADYPEAPHATVPPGLLERLPPLPDPLEYAILGRHLVLLDTEADLILDTLAGALDPDGP